MGHPRKENKKPIMFCHYRVLHDGRNGGVRTRDLLVPNQAHYQAVLRPDALTREVKYTIGVK